MKLMSMTDFVLDRCEPDVGSDLFYFLCSNYAFFLKQRLTLGMFVPCDEDGNVLVSFDDRYEEFKERVLFENVSLQHAKWLVETYSLVEDITSIQASMMPLHLTEEALKQIGL